MSHSRPLFGHFAYLLLCCCGMWNFTRLIGWLVGWSASPFVNHSIIGLTPLIRLDSVLESVLLDLPLMLFQRVLTSVDISITGHDRTMLWVNVYFFTQVNTDHPRPLVHIDHLDEDTHLIWDEMDQIYMIIFWWPNRRVFCFPDNLLQPSWCVDSSCLREILQGNYPNS